MSGAYWEEQDAIDVEWALEKLRESPRDRRAMNEVAQLVIDKLRHRALANLRIAEELEFRMAQDRGEV